MKLPEDVRQLLARRFQSKHREWLVGDPGEGQWPLEVPLGVPTEQAALRQVDGVRAWVSAWQGWQGGGTLSWCERRWKALGVQRLPEKLALGSPEDVAMWIGESARWERAQSGSVRISVCEAVGLFSVTVRRPLTVLPVPAR